MTRAASPDGFYEALRECCPGRTARAVPDALNARLLHVATLLTQGASYSLGSLALWLPSAGAGYLLPVAPQTVRLPRALPHQTLPPPLAASPSTCAETGPLTICGV
jgi:hypothetical protein